VYFSPKQFILGCVLTIINSLISGIGLLLLIPLLHYTGWLPPISGLDNNFLGGMINRLPLLHGHLPLLFTLASFVLLIAIFASISYWQNLTMANFRQDYLFKLRQQLNNAIAHAKWSYFLTQKSQDVEYMVSVGISQIAMLTYYCLQMISTSIVIIFYLTFSLIVAFKLTLLTVVIAAALFLILRKHKATLLGEQNFLIQQKMQEQLARFLDGLKLAKSYNRIDAYVTHFSQLSLDSLKFQQIFSRNQATIQWLFLVFSAIIFSVLFYFAVGIFQVHMVVLVTLLLLFARLLPQVSAWQQGYLQTMNILPVFNRAQILLAEFQAAQDQPSTDKTMQFCQEIHLDNISYAFTKSPTLSGISACISANTTTAIVGPSGAGKSTLADLLLGLLVTQAGKIYIDGAVLEEKNLFAWRQLVSYVPQESHLFNDTIKANLLWAAPDATDEQLWEVLDLSAAYFVRHLPLQLDTLIGDRGIHLSGGERQRIAIARALLRNPKVLILDEATSALDAENEELIYQTLRKLHGKITMIIISHRYSTIQGADHVLVLEKGQLIEYGKPQQLLTDKTSRFTQLMRTGPVVSQTLVN